MIIRYLGEGVYEAESRSEKGTFHRVVPKELECSCKSTVIMCEHLKQTMARIRDNWIGISNLALP